MVQGGQYQVEFEDGDIKSIQKVRSTLVCPKGGEDAATPKAAIAAPVRGQPATSAAV